ncbi:MAG TPA: DUF2892 domain-containing protein [Ktedonobacterales bacterium]|jgi:uncharacterized membrane protein|nr:DUF2892 domain-containing protein [Ktedonobacterales bacterium]
MLPKNEGALDRLLRALVGVALVVIMFTALSGIAQIIVGVVAAILLVTAAIGFCPLYALLRISTNSHKVTHA